MKQVSKFGEVTLDDADNGVDGLVFKLVITFLATKNYFSKRYENLPRIEINAILQHFNQPMRNICMAKLSKSIEEFFALHIESSAFGAL